MDSIEIKVRAGADLLDRVVSGWAGRVDPSLITSCDGEGSILDQLFGTYWIGVDELHLSTPSQLDYGFRAGDPSIEGRLVTAWLTQVAQRRQPEPTVVVRSPARGRATRLGTLKTS